MEPENAVQTITLANGFKTTKTIKILSIDGGGIKGIIPAILLAEIEKRAQKPICQIFDIIAGTSTGGLITLALSVPDVGSTKNKNFKPKFSAQELVKIYEEDGKKAFARNLVHSAVSLGNLINEKHPLRGLESVLDKYVGDAKLSDALTNVIVTAYEIEHRGLFFFKSHMVKIDPDHDFYMKTAGLATAAAPTYFEPVVATSISGKKTYHLIDGGVFANNPALVAYVEAVKMFPEAHDFVLVSLGTGEHTEPIKYKDAKNWGVAEWAVPILNVVFDGTSDLTDYHLKKLIPEMQGIQRYFRFQTQLTRCSSAMDNVTGENLIRLKELAYKLIADKSKLFDALVGLL